MNNAINEKNGCMQMMHCSSFIVTFFVLQRKMQGSCMSEHENKRCAKKDVRCKCMVKK